MLAQSTLISDLTRINFLLKSCSETAAELQQNESSVVPPPGFRCEREASSDELQQPGSSVVPLPGLPGEREASSIAVEKSSVTSGDIPVLPPSSSTPLNNTPSSPPKGILKRLSEENIHAPAAAIYIGNSPGVRRFAQRLLPKNIVAVGGEVPCSLASEKPGNKKRVTFSLDCGGDTSLLVDDGDDFDEAAVGKTAEGKKATEEEEGGQWSGEGGSISGSNEQKKECNESGSDNSVILDGCDSEGNQTNDSNQHVTISYNDSVNISKQVDNYDEVFELEKYIGRTNDLEENDKRNSSENCSSLGSSEPSDGHHSANYFSTEKDETQVLETPIHFASIVEIIHSDVIKENCSSDMNDSNTETTEVEGGDVTKNSAAGHKKVRCSTDEDISRRDSTSSVVINETENDWDTGEGDSDLNGEDDDVDIDDIDDDTMLVHEVDEDNILVCPNSFGHFMSHMFEGIGEQHQNKITKTNGSASVNRTMSTQSCSTSDDVINNKEEDTEIIKLKANKINALQTFDREEMTANRSTYSRMYLRQFKSNIYKGRKWASQSVGVERQLSQDTEESDSPTPLPTPPTTPLTKSYPDENQLLQKLDHISKMLDQINNGCLQNSPNLASEALNQTVKPRPGQSSAIFQYGGVYGGSPSSVNSKTLQEAFKHIFYFAIAVLLYLLSVLALLAITFPRLDMSMQHSGLSPV